MPALFIFLLKVNAALLLFCAGYYLVLRHLTFYTLNRVYLISAIVFATVYPQINLDTFFQHHQQLAQPVYVMVDNLHLPDDAAAQPAYWNWLEAVFYGGVIVLAIKLGMQLFSLYKVYRASRKEEIMGHNVRVVNGDGGPFSFWKSIYVNPTGYTESDLRAILKHEQIHTDEWHTLDILLAELSVIFYWFNPGVWLMRKAVRENIEFITDRKILQQGADTKQYQYSLLNVSFSNSKPGIANHFNISTLKKRILMMNAKRSSNVNLTRYAFLVPVLLVLLLSFSVTRAAIVKTSKLTYKAISLSVDKIILDNPVTSKIQAIFGDSAKMPVVARKKDTIKVIRVGKKDTVKIIVNNINIEPAFQISGRDSSSKIIHMINFIGADSAKHKNITHIRINGKDYQSIDDGSFVEKDDLIRRGLSAKRDTITFRNVVIDDNPINVSSKSDTVLSRRGGGRAFGGSGMYPPRVALGYALANKGTPAIVVTGQPRVAKYSLNYIFNTDSANTAKADELVKHLSGFTVNADGSVTHEGKAVTLTNTPTKRMDIVTVLGRPREASIDSIQNRLILINGKEATEKDLKKVPASAIEKLKYQRANAELTKQYGEKAKNGVLFITTIKQK